jgi:hypothetical protein
VGLYRISRKSWGSVRISGENLIGRRPCGFRETFHAWFLKIACCDAAFIEAALAVSYWKKEKIRGFLKKPRSGTLVFID